MPELKVEQVFGTKSLDGSLPIKASFSPDGNRLVYLKHAEDDRERLDIWSYDIDSGSSLELINVSKLSQLFIPSERHQTDEEKAESERRRMFNSGVTSYFWHPSSNALLFPVQGALYIFDFESTSVQQITPAGTRQTDFALSPTGDSVSYVRGGDLYQCSLTESTEKQLTHNASTTRSNGLASFIAQEEMHLFEGHWWSPDGTKIAYTEIDTNDIPESQRYEIDADNFHSYAQRYPYAGALNARTTLFVIDLPSMTTQSIEYHSSDDLMQAPYLARIQFTPDSKHLFLQVQSRNQQSLELKCFTLATKLSQVVLTERHSTWINLHNNLQFLPQQQQTEKFQFLWTSERNNLSQIYHYEQDTSEAGSYRCTQITDGQCRVNRITGQSENLVYFEGWQESPTEQHLFSVELGACSPATQITNQSGWHDCQMNKNCTYYVDQRSSLYQPASMYLHSIKGTLSRVVAQNYLDESNAYYPWLKDHSTPQLGHLTASDGQILHFRLTKPTSMIGGKKYPVVICVYGGPGVQLVKNEWCSLTLQLFAQAGFGVFELDNRGSSNRAKSFEDPIFGQLGKIEVEDQLLGTEYLSTLNWVDVTCLGIFGHSYGGYMTLKCLYQAPGIFKAGVAIAPVTDWHLYDTHYTERYLGLPDANTSGYSASNVLPLRGDLRSDLLIMHGMSDDNVLFTHSTKLFKALQDSNSVFEMMTYPGAKHSMQQQSVLIHRYNTIIRFFRRVFSGKV